MIFPYRMVSNEKFNLLNNFIFLCTGNCFHYYNNSSFKKLLDTSLTQPVKLALLNFKITSFVV